MKTQSSHRPDETVLFTGDTLSNVAAMDLHARTCGSEKLRTCWRVRIKYESMTLK